MILNKKIRAILWLFLCMWVATSGVSCINHSKHKPFSFGVIADIQYADKDIKGKRHYRRSIENLKQCVDSLNSRELAFTIQVGDIIDRNETAEQTASDLKQIVKIYNQLTMPAYHVVGNHCMRADTELLNDQLELESFYYDSKVPEADKWRFIVLDGNDAGYGVLGDEQLKWLAAKLDSLQQQGERVIVFNHFPLLKDATAKHLMKAPEPVLGLIEKSGCVVAYFAGHDHAGGYALQNGIHHITMHGMVEAPDENAYAIIDVLQDKLVIHGFGKEPNRELGLTE